jgi:hypothetical protein
MEKGLVKMKNFANSKNKFSYLYVFTLTGMAEKAAIAYRFLQRKMDEYEALKAEIEALRSEVEKSGGDGTQKTRSAQRSHRARYRYRKSRAAEQKSP